MYLFLDIYTLKVKNRKRGCLVTMFSLKTDIGIDLGTASVLVYIKIRE